MKLSVTGGVVSVEDGIKKPEEFAPPRKVRVELHFDVPEGEDANSHIGAVANLAQAHVGSLLGGKVPEGVRPIKPATMAGASTGAPEPGTKAAIEAAMIRSLKGEPPASEATVAASGPKRTVKKVEAPKEPEKPKADPEELAPSAPAEPAPADQDDLGDMLGETEKVAPITDLELNNAVQKRNAVIKSGLAIRKLIQTFNPDPEKFPVITLSQIPQDKRGPFLKALEVLQAE